MADEKRPQAKVEFKVDVDGAEPEVTASSEGARGDAAGAGSGADVAETVRAGAGRVGAWVSRTFPGHEHAFWGGVLGLLAALVFFAIGFFRTLLIVVLIVVGVAVGQALDGDPKLINAVRRFFVRNQ